MTFIVNSASSELFSSFELEPPHPINKNDRKIDVRKYIKVQRIKKGLPSQVALNKYLNIKTDLLQ